MSGIRIPEDLSIVGFDNISFATAISPALTTIAQPIHELAQIAISLLIDNMQERKALTEGQRIVLDTTLIVRDSCQRYEGNT